MPAPPDDLPGMAGHPAGNRQARRRFIARSTYFTVPGTVLAIGVLYELLPPLRGMETAAERLALACRWLFVAMLPYAAVCLTVLGARFLEGSHDPLARAESERLQIHCRVMQNTLEQLVWLAICLLALATLLEPAQARLIPIACGWFAFARIVYWWGYFRQGTLGRAPGVQLTFSLTVPLALLTAVLFVREVWR
jgi:uncharacterized membrane protein YecN with MAPEG domain